MMVAMEYETSDGYCGKEQRTEIEESILKLDAPKKKFAENRW